MTHMIFKNINQQLTQQIITIYLFVYKSFQFPTLVRKLETFNEKHIDRLCFCTFQAYSWGRGAKYLQPRAA